MDKFLLGIELKGTLFYLFFNNPSFWLDLFVYALFLSGVLYYQYKLLAEQKLLKIESLRSEIVRNQLEEAKNKLRPKFLFTTLAAMEELIVQKKYKDANTVLSALSDFLRTTVCERNSGYTTVENEILFLRNFVEIENLHSRYPIEFHVSVDNEVNNAIIPDFIFHPILSDMLKAVEFLEGTRTIHFVFEKHERNLFCKEEFSVQNSFVDQNSIIDGLAVIAIIRERLAYLRKNNFILQIVNSKNSIIVAIVLPYTLQNEQYNTEFAIE